MASNFIPESIVKDLKIIGWYQITGGLTGLFKLVKGLVDGVQYSNADTALYSFVFILCSFSASCGWFCIRSNKKAIGFSFINLVLQSTVFSIGGISYCYLAGAYLLIGGSITDYFRIYFDFGLAKFQFFFGLKNQSDFIAFNLPALVFLYWLYRLKKHVALEVAIDEADSIGADD